ncbi:hypothetical protein INT44_000737 [Umbelopsis vinacea]|uniref:RING-type domain-containing protein n=1 Tax=Umbelopsis vinacea TaxID=44442 RepID=A0A8H7UN97_9FUNG|nr:hypothetical protein INT44_000737 [Umbelopsis vinacea]
MTTVQPGSLDELEKLGRFIEILDIDAAESDGQQFAHQLADASFSNSHLQFLRAFIKYIEGEKIAVLVWVNMFYCCLVLIGKVISKAIFGRIMRLENQASLIVIHLYDNMLNFILFKVIFICTVMNPRWGQVLVLALWIGILGFLHIFCKLSRDRFDHLSVTPSVPMVGLYKIVGLLCFILISCFLWYYGCIHLFPSMLAFLTLETVPVAIDTSQLLIKYVAHIIDNLFEDQMESKGVIMYYSELTADLLILLCTILQYLQLLWMHGKSFGWTDIILLLNLRSAFKHLGRKITTHGVHWKALTTIRSSYLHATSHDLLLYGDQCAICRDKMKEAIKLPCGHCFHLSCLHSWVHHRPFQATCPTCRSTIGPSPSLDNTSAEAAVTSSIWGGKYLLALLPWNIEVSLTARNPHYDDASSVYSVDDRDENFPSGIPSGSSTPYRTASYADLHNR